MNPITLRAVLHRGLKGTHVLTSCLALAATATLLLSAHGQPASPSPTPYTPVLSIGGTLAQLNSEVLLSLKNVAPTDRAANRDVGGIELTERVALVVVRVHKDAACRQHRCRCPQAGHRIRVAQSNRGARQEHP